MARTVVIGLAGGSGTGKSTVAAHLVARHGGVHVDGDRIGHDVLDDSAVARRLRATFGDDVAPNDHIDRRILGPLVFADENRLAQLNAIVHPAIVARCDEAVANARAKGVPLAVVDAALLLEVPMSFVFDRILALTCDPEIRVQRLLAKGGHSEARIRDRLARQAAMEKHFYKADGVVDTGRDLQAVLADVDAWVDPLVQSARDTESEPT